MRATITLVFAAALTISAAAQDFMAPAGVPAGVFPKPDRPVADIVSPIWHDEKERDDADEPGQLVAFRHQIRHDSCGHRRGQRLLRHTRLLIVGSNGRIIAEDIVPDYLRSLRNRVRNLGLQNVAIRRGEPHDPRLPAGSLDIAIFLVHMYHEIARPYALLYNLVPALKADARVGIVDAFGPTSKHGTPPSLLRCELAAVGYREISLERLTGQLTPILGVFAPPSVASRTRPEAMVTCKAP